MGKNNKRRHQKTFGSFSELAKHKYGSKPLKKKTNPHNSTGANNKSTVFPYYFAERKSGKKEPEQFHDCLLKDNFDIAFEIEWKALTPLALNPCVDYSAKPNCPEKDKDTDYAGYNRRWLMIDNSPAISPFTVKSAIANGFANLMGGCYRVNTKEEKHKDYGPGQYPYPGRYKRYRVARDGSSKPGIVKSISIFSNGNREIEIKPVSEFYSDCDLPKKLDRNDEVCVKIENRGYKPPIVEIVKDPREGDKKVLYHGEYHFGRDLCDPYRKKHKHRFYVEKKEKTVKGTIRAENFLNEEGMKKIVYMGGRDQNNNSIRLWHEKLSDLKAGDFIYYETFNGRVCHIGKNFLFKALFLHEDAVPEENSECKNVSELCPRCGMFGMTDKTKEEQKIVGFKGRFKSATLISDEKCASTEEKKANFPFLNDLEDNKKPELTQWLDDAKNTIAYQSLLPISAPPKPNKKDAGGIDRDSGKKYDGYFDRDSGEIKGAKVYHHGRRDSAMDINGVDHKPENDYSHTLRNYAQVCKSGMEFEGTVGAENCTIEEIAALLILLHSPLAHHGFKLGLGKAFGMGSVESRINKIWIRKPESYEWTDIEELTGLEKDDFLEKIKARDSNIAGKIEENMKINDFVQKINSIQPIEDGKTLDEYPSPGPKYWEYFWR